MRYKRELADANYRQEISKKASPAEVVDGIKVKMSKNIINANQKYRSNQPWYASLTNYTIEEILKKNAYSEKACQTDENFLKTQYLSLKSNQA